MFDGSLPTLDALIDHYASGGAEHPGKSPFITGSRSRPKSVRICWRFYTA
jgi:hypothetical protein